MTMPVEDLDETWEALAGALDAAGPRSERFLAKLALLLAHELGDAARMRELIRAALEDLE
jgi:hypothetical protein